MKLFNYITIICLLLSSLSSEETIYREDTASKKALSKRIPGSHIKVFFPDTPYLYLSKLINGTLVRSSDNSQGWEYMMATAHKQITPTEYIFNLRENTFFQDGTAFDANSIIENFDYLLNSTFTCSPIFSYLKSVKKISNYAVKFIFKEPYELFLSDLTLLNLYSSKYLKKYAECCKEASTADSMEGPGPYGLGPYILKKGYATGRSQTPVIKLEANPFYYESPMPYIEKITIYTELTTEESLKMLFKEEGSLDISPIPINKKVETVLSPFTKLVSHPSTHNISVYYNMLKPNGILKDKKIRQALNEAIDQDNLLKFVLKNEGLISPSIASQNYYSVLESTKDMLTHQKRAKAKDANFKKQLKSILNGLTLKVYTMEQWMFLWHGIEYQLNEYGVNLIYDTATSEKDLFNELLSNRKSPKDWDILLRRNDDWLSNNPWTVFFAFRPGDIWSTIEEDHLMQQYLKTFIQTPFNSKDYIDIVSKISKRAYEESYMMALPSPNVVLAVNKEIDYVHSSVLMMPLWKTRLTSDHWSIRKGSYPKEKMMPIEPKGYLK